MNKISRGIQLANTLSLGIVSKIIPGDFFKQAFKRSWAQKMVSLRGVPLKFSQILSMSPNESISKYQKEAIADIEPLQFRYFLDHVGDSLKELVGITDEVDEVGIPASLGQVHKVQMKDGRCCALKIQYPHNKDMMDMDSMMINLMGNSFQNFKEGFDMDEYQRVIRKELEVEMDYETEANVQNLVYQYFREEDQIIIPKPMLMESNSQFILMDWVEGKCLDDFLQETTENERKEATRLITTFFFTCIFELGYIHADPNPGNFMFSRKNGKVSLVVYDYGSMVPIERTKSLTLLKLIESLENDQIHVIPWLTQLGFKKELLEPLGNKLNAFLDLIFEPFLVDGVYSLRNWNRKNRASDILGDDRWNFMVAAPAELLPFMRSVQGLFYYANMLSGEINTHSILRKLKLHHYGDLKNMEPPKVHLDVEDDLVDMAKFLHIAVWRNQQKSVDLKLPRRSIENIHNIMDDELKDNLEKENIDIDAVVKKSREQAYVPMELFKIEKDNSTVLVELI